MTLIVAELATAHGGDVELAAEMVRAAAAAGADIVKTQHYQPLKVRPSDPQHAWLVQSHLTAQQQAKLMTVAAQSGVTFMSTPFCADSLRELRDIGLTHFKIASSESGNDWWDFRGNEEWFVSYPWGRGTLALGATHLTAIPLYPTPLECVGQAHLLDGYSDHCEGFSACEYAIARGAKVIEVHFKIEGKGRNTAWDKDASDIQRLRAFADDIATIQTGVSTRFRTRWTGAA